MLGLVVVLSVASALAPPPLVEPVAPPSAPPPASVVAWVKAHAVPISPPQSPPAPSEAAAVDRAVAGARVIGFGENEHGRAEPLAYRNRLIRHLVEHDGLTAVALESGFAESRGLYDYVLGAPGDARALIGPGLTHDFGRLRENLELVEWLRVWNAAHSERTVRLYGIDLSTIQSAPPNARGYGVVLDQIDAYLARAAPRASAGVRARLRPFARRFTENDYSAYGAAERAEISAALASTADLMRARRVAMVRATSALDYAWAAEEVEDARRLLLEFADWNDAVAIVTDDPVKLASLKRVLTVRDTAMADHLAWVLRREGPRGKVLVFQSLGHVAATPMVGSVTRLFSSQAPTSGALLRARMGAAYRTIAAVSSYGRGADDPTLGSVDRAFGAAGVGPSFLDLRTPGRLAWWDQPQSVSHGEHRVDDLIPTRTFDALLYLPNLTPVTPLAPPPK